MANASDVAERPLPLSTSERFIAPALLDQAVAALQRKLASAPQDAQAWRRLGDLHRRRGDLPAALNAYRKLQALQSDATANWLVDVTSGEALSAPQPEGVQAAPFLRMTSFLTHTQRERLLALTRKDKASFVPARVTDAENGKKGRVYPEVRHALHPGPQATREVRRWFVPKLRRLVPRVAAHLQLGQLNNRFFELEITAYLSSGLFRMHSDSQPPNDNRIISYVCYFHEEPRRFNGGELLLHDCCRGSVQANPSCFTRFDPVGNSVVFFPSDCLHQVLRVDCPEDSLRNGRLSVNGWVRVKTAAASPPAPANGASSTENPPDKPATAT